VITKLPLITLEDENDFQWAAIGAVGMLLIVMIVVMVGMARALRRDRARAERMERPVSAESIQADAERLRSAARREPPEWQRYGGPE
jgi:choline-glycine betaine transporter